MKKMRKILVVAAIGLLAMIPAKITKADTVTPMKAGVQYTTGFTGNSYEYFEFTMERDGLLTVDNTVKTTGSSASIYLYSGNDYSNAFKSYRLGDEVSRYYTKRTFYFKKGTYCFGIHGYFISGAGTGDFVIKATPTYLNTNTSANIDTYDNAQTLTSGQKITGVHGEDKKQSWFKFTLNKAKVVSMIYNPNMDNNDLIIYNSSLQMLEYLNGEADRPTTYYKKMAAGTYYIALRNYAANKFTLYYKTNEIPSTVTVSSVRAKKKAMQIYLRKQSGITKYQVQYAMKSNFSGAKTITTSATSIGVKKLKSKKSYFVRSRAYVRVNGVNYYGSWGNVKKTKVK